MSVTYESRTSGHGPVAGDGQGDGHGDGHHLLAHQFENLPQQHYAASLGMWVFLASEVLFFGGLFTAYTVYRNSPGNQLAAGSAQLNDVLGAVNTAVLLTSSLTMALAVRAAQLGNRRGVQLFIGLTLVLGLAFLGVKVYEWRHEYTEGLVPVLNWERERWVEKGIDPDRPKMFFVFYFIITGLHALHMIIGVGVMIWLLSLAFAGRFARPVEYAPVEVSGLYWHFVDIVWIFVFPVLYLLRH